MKMKNIFKPFNEEPICVYGPPEYFAPAQSEPFSAPDDASEEYKKLVRCANAVRQQTAFEPRVALVLGSGLGAFAENCAEIISTVDYSSIPDFPISTVPGHKGRFIFGYVDEVPVVIMQGRVHYYEGYKMSDVVLPARLMGMLGAKVLFLTNASGGINSSFSAGDFMLIRDHISCFVPNPLIGRNQDELGTRFPDMSNVYDNELCEAIISTAEKEEIALRQGVYLQLTGPSFETPAEIKMLRGFGADAVGMSTSIEAIAAHHAGMRVCGISCISNLACGMTDKPLTHAEVQEAADKAAPRFEKLITGSIKAIAQII